jgi:hypothetical protein
VTWQRLCYRGRKVDSIGVSIDVTPIGAPSAVCDLHLQAYVYSAAGAVTATSRMCVISCPSSTLAGTHASTC